MKNILHQKKKLSVIIACYRDAEAIPLMYQRLTAVFTKLPTDYELIFVNDNSPDKTLEILTPIAAKDKRVIVVNHTRNFGSQGAFTSGMHIAGGDAVVLLDGDLQDPPEIIETFYQKWMDGYEVVYGVKGKTRYTDTITIGVQALLSNIPRRFLCTHTS